ncbi:MAG: LamG domain-containing protein [Candidatus Competibacteraceae bacterium]|nr:MAG: LamG domain-containing protein [Candidatus Competibacteraceae bacterium]
MSDTRRIDSWVVSVFFVLLMTTSPLIYADLADGLVAYYPFDGNANDQSGNNNHGIENGGIQYQPGISGNAVKFDGVDDYIRVPSSSSLNPVNQLSISFWVKVEGFTNGWSPIIHKGGPILAEYANREYSAFVSMDSAFSIASAGDGATHIYYYACCATVNYWRHYVGIIDRQNHRMKIYVDGVLKVDGNDPYSTFNNNNNDLIIGSSEEVISWLSPFRGWIDELRIYNRALTDDEIQALFDANSTIQAIMFTETWETPVITDGAVSTSIIFGGWRRYFGAVSNSSIWNTNSSERFNQTNPLAPPAGGNQILFLSGLNAGIYRMSGLLIEPNTTYTLSAAIGNDLLTAHVEYWSLQVWADSDNSYLFEGSGRDTFIGQQFGTTATAVNPEPGNWALNSFLFDSSTTPALVGQQLIIFLNNFGSNAASFYDNVSFYAVKNSPTSLRLEPHQWHLISPLPLDGGGGGTVGEIVGDDIHAGNLPSSIYGNAGADGWIMYQHNALTNLYENLSIDSLLTVGQGYWLKTLAANQQRFTVSGNANSITPIDLEAAPTPANGRSNMLGHPYDYNVCWNDAQISNDNFATFETPTTADPGNICDTDPADPTCILSRKMYQWNGAAYQTFDGTTPGAEGVLEPFDGFFVKVFKPGYQLQIPATPSCQGVTAATHATLTRALKTTDDSDPESKSMAKKVRNPDEWNIRLTVSAEGLTDPGNLIGRLNDSRNGHDAHDLDERPADFNPHLTLVFPHHDWGNHAGDYTTDFRALERNLTGATDWDFEIRSDQLRTITLTWDIDNQDIRNHSRLIDVENNVKIKPKKVNRYTIPMVGTTHRFTWRMQAGR